DAAREIEPAADDQGIAVGGQGAAASGEAGHSAKAEAERLLRAVLEPRDSVDGQASGGAGGASAGGGLAPGDREGRGGVGGAGAQALPVRAIPAGDVDRGLAACAEISGDDQIVVEDGGAEDLGLGLVAEGPPESAVPRDDTPAEPEGREASGDDEVPVEDLER